MPRASSHDFGRIAVRPRTPDGGTTAEADPLATFTSCDADRSKLIGTAITEAKALADRALTAFDRPIPLSYERRAIQANFGDPSSSQQSRITAVYKHIRDQADAKTYTCAARDKSVPKGNTRVDLCAQATCPGNDVTIFPKFGTAGCAAGPTLLHEVAHNAGASGDVDHGTGYPPSAPEENAYSYEYCALQIAAGYQEPDVLKKRSTPIPEAPGSAPAQP